MKTITIEPKPQFLLDEKGNPKSVLLDYDLYREILEMLEDYDCEKVIAKRLAEKDEPFPETVEEI